MGSLTVLPPRGPEPPAPNPQVISLLKELLERALTGEFAGIAVAVVNDEGRILTTFTDNDEDCEAALVGACAVLLTRISSEG